MTDLTDHSIVEAAALLERRQASARELVEATLARIAATEPAVHAYTLVLADQAREDAQRADAELAAGRRRGELHGIPIAVKDLCDIAGWPTEAGSRALAGRLAATDATVVRRLRAAGAIPIGKTVTHELALGVNVPPTRSPWGVDSYPGGSSAGSGAAVAARSAYAAIGTDTGGSIREPAALNGVVGLKPTFGLVGRAGIVPLSASLDHAGPLTRTVPDCALLLQALAGHDPGDSGSSAAPPDDYRRDLEAGAAGMTIGVERRLCAGGPVAVEVRQAVEAVIDEYARLGARIVDVEIPHLELMGTTAIAIILGDAAAVHGRLLQARGADIEAATRQLLELGELLPATHYITAQRARRLIRDAMRAVFAAHALDAVLWPTTPTTTMPIDGFLLEDESGQDPMTAAFTHMVAANLTGQPALSVPCGHSAAGLPIGCQLIGRPFADASLLRLARAYEREHRWAAQQPALA